MKNNVQQTLQLSGSIRSEAANHFSLPQLSWQAEPSRATYRPKLVLSPDYPNDQEYPHAGSLVGASGTCLRDGGTPSQEVSGVTGDCFPNTISLMWEERSFPK